MRPLRTSIRVAVVHESPLVEHGVRALLEERIPVIEVVESDAEADLALIDPWRYSIVELDRQIETLRGRCTHVALFAWVFSDAHRWLLEQRRLDGIVSKALRGSVLAASVERIVRDGWIIDLDADESSLSHRDRWTLQLLHQGLSETTVAASLARSADRFSDDLAELFGRIGVGSRQEASDWTRNAGLVDGLPAPTP